MVSNVHFYIRCSFSFTPNIKIIFNIIKLWTAGYRSRGIKLG
nr:MAG TPA: Protein of unknown function (DUF1445) [Caudoviricetes sp.]